MIVEIAAWIVVLCLGIPLVLCAIWYGGFAVYFLVSSTREAIENRRNENSYLEWAKNKGGSGIVFKESEAGE